MALPTLWFWTFGLQSHKRRHSAVLSHRLLFGSPQTNISNFCHGWSVSPRGKNCSLVLVSPQVSHFLAVPQSRSRTSQSLFPPLLIGKNKSNWTGLLRGWGDQMLSRSPAPPQTLCKHPSTAVGTRFTSSARGAPILHSFLYLLPGLGLISEVQDSALCANKTLWKILISITN